VIEPAIDYGEELTRVVDFLRSMPLAKLSRPVHDGPTRAEVARAVAQWLADAGARTQGRPVRAVPDVGDAAVGDQIAVTGADLLRTEPDEEVLAEAAGHLRTLRLSI
jgi:hypothetical protein